MSFFIHMFKKKLPARKFYDVQLLLSSVLTGLHLNFVEAPIHIGKRGKNSPAEEAKDLGFWGLLKAVKEYLYTWKYVVE